MTIIQCADIASDRALGEYWEKRFLRMGVEYHKFVVPLQLKREGAIVGYELAGERIKSWTMPDAITGDGSCEAHEIKHKDPSKKGYIGLEKYRWNALVKIADRLGIVIRYTIHNYALVPGYSRAKEDRLRCKLYRENEVGHWVTATVNELKTGQVTGQWGFSYINGRSESDVEMVYWPIEKFSPLSRIWKIG